MTAPNEARPPATSPQPGKVTSPLVKGSGTLAHTVHCANEISNAARRSGVGLPLRDWQAGFQSRA